MCSSTDLANAMKSALEENGDLTKVKAQLEEEVLEFNNQSAPGRASSEFNFTTKLCKPAMPPEIILANNIVRQYLEYVGLRKTSSVLCTESGLPEKSVPENILNAVFPKVHKFGDKPLLQCMITTILENDN